MDFDSLKEAAKQAIKNATGAAGGETDPDLALYNKLKPSHFPKLIEKYGVEGTLSYINEMERRKAQKNANT